MGTSEYSVALAAIKPVLEKSNCHTLDRYDFRAQKDVCGVGPGRLWESAVKERFVINYWPYVNAGETVKNCVEKTFVDSFVNLSKSSAKAGYQIASALTIGGLILAQTVF